jgi:hypothetical protein
VASLHQGFRGLGTGMFSVRNVRCCNPGGAMTEATGDDCVEEKLLLEHEAEAEKHGAEFINYGAYSDLHEILSKTSKGKLASWIDPVTMQVGHEWIPYKSNIDTLLDEYWLQHYLGHDLCTLCGNSGVIDTRGVKDPMGREVGRLNYCVCPNGRAMRDAEEFPLRQERKP